jgi:hypothetical protein
MYVLSMLFSGISIAGSVVWCIHRANRRVMQIIHEEVEAPRLTAAVSVPAPRPATSTAVLGAELGNSNLPSADEHDDVRKAVLRNRSQ